MLQPCRRHRHCFRMFFCAPHLASETAHLVGLCLGGCCMCGICPIRQKQNRPAGMHRPNVYLEPKWLRYFVFGVVHVFTAHNYPPLSTTDRDRTSCLGLRTHQSALASVSTDVISQCKPNCQAHYPVKLLLSPMPSNPVTPHKSIIPGSPLCPSTSMTAHIPCTPHASETKHLPFWLLQF